jgi:hypothetical protein
MAAATGSDLASTALALVADGEGILAADETSRRLPSATPQRRGVYSEEMERGFRGGECPVPRGEDD